MVGGYGADAKRRNLRRMKNKKAALENVGRFLRNPKFLAKNLFRREIERITSCTFAKVVESDRWWEILIFNGNIIVLKRETKGTDTSPIPPRSTL